MSSDYLKDMNSEWQVISARKRTYSGLPEGNYRCRIESAQLKENKQGNPVVNWQLRIISGDYENCLVYRMEGVLHESLPFLKADLELLGICPDNLSDLENCLPFSLDAVVEVHVKNCTLKSGKRIQNVFFNRLIKPGRRSVQTAVDEGFTLVTNEDLPWGN